METLLSPSTSRRSLNANSSSRPTWLLSTLSELEERMKILAMNPNTEDHQQLQENEGDTFAERAESYYRKRPQLLALLQDLYNSYVTLSDRFMQSNSKNTPVAKRHVVQASVSTNDAESESDVESSLSYQQPQEEQAQESQWEEQAQESQWASKDYDAVVAELVAKSVEVEVASEEAATWERRFNESARKAELQRSLLEVLESERVVLLNENARLEYQAASLAEENSGLAAEAHFVRCRAAELARRAVARAREDQRVCQLSMRIEDLQGQIHGLEKRNREQQQLGFQSCSGCSSSSFSSSSVSLKNELAAESKRDDVAFEGCFKVIRNIEFSPIIRKLEFSSPMAMVSVVDEKEKEIKEKKSGLVSFWGRVKKMDLFVCGAKSSSSSSA